MFFCLLPVFGQDIDDNQLIDAINTEDKVEQDSNPDRESFELHSFDSCEEMSTITKKYLKESIKNQLQNGYYGWPVRVFRWGEPEIMEMALEDTVSAKALDGVWGGWWGIEFSETNIQVSWVDEPDIVKMNSRIIASYQQPQWNKEDRKQSPHAVHLTKYNQAWELDIVRRLQLPDTLSGIQLFLDETTLVILGSKWSQNEQEPRLVEMAWNQKTVVAVFDIQNPDSPELVRYSLLDGWLSQARKEGSNLYVLAQNHVSINPWAIMEGRDGEQLDVTEALKTFEEDFDNQDILPWVTDFYRHESKQLEISGKKYNYGVDIWTIPCENIRYHLPSPETQEEYNTLPEFVTIATIDLSNTKSNIKTQVLFWNVGTIYMSKDTLYTVSSLYTQSWFACPFDAMCIMPRFTSQQNSLIHKLDIDNNFNYEGSTIVPWTPLTQYAMHERDEYFHIVTQSWSPDTEVSVFVLDDELKPTWSIRDIAPWEDFKSSRFMGDELYLVTFEQVDPLFSIDLSDPNNPTIRGELKIPGFSTYLHPYDDDHLIGIWYDTIENEWWGIQTAGIKIDLYDISDFDNPTQKYTKTFWGRGSYSEVLNNPRAFVWQADNNLLLMPAQLMEQGDDYQMTSAWQWIIGIRIDDKTGISLDGEMTHLDMSTLHKERLKACEKYSQPEPRCYTIIGTDEEVCDARIDTEWQIPRYCFEEFDDTAYLAERIWEYNHQFISRVTYAWNTAFSLSPSAIHAHSLSDYSTLTEQKWDQK